MPRKLMMPASNLKILTLAAAAETLGWDYRFTTDARDQRTVEGGVLHGDLVVRSNGDPTINARDASRGRVVRRMGGGAQGGRHHAVEGNVVGDAQAFDAEGSARDGRGTTCSTATPRRSARSSSTRTSPTLLHPSRCESVGATAMLA